jgi:hypothetical protein
MEGTIGYRLVMDVVIVAIKTMVLAWVDHDGKEPIEKLATDGASDARESLTEPDDDDVRSL